LTEDSSWWSEETISADSAEEAAMKLLSRVKVESHTRIGERYILCRVHKIEEDYEEFKVRNAVEVEET